MGAHTPDAYRYGDGQLPREYPRPGARSTPSPSATGAPHRGVGEESESSVVQSSPFAPREQQTVSEREYAHRDEHLAGALPTHRHMAVAVDTMNALVETVLVVLTRRPLRDLHRVWYRSSRCTYPPRR